MGVFVCQARRCWRTSAYRFSSSRQGPRKDDFSTTKAPKIPTAIGPKKTSDEADAPQRCRTFLEEQTFRRAQAHRSVLVQVPSASFAGALQQQYEEFGPVRCMFHYRQKDKDFILTELDSRDGVSSLMNAGCHQKRDDIVPVRSRLFDGSALRNWKLLPCDKLVQDESSSADDIDQTLRLLPDMSSQMTALYQLVRLPELGSRLRYFISSQIEEAISGIFPSNRVYLFGSSVNGFGHQNSDVDMILDFDVGHTGKAQTQNETAFKFASKAAAGNERIQTQRSLELLADHIQHLLPGYSNVQRILMARVPIVKFSHDCSGTQCDLSITNMTGLVMTDYLYTLGQIDDRLRALVVTVRRWAKANQLTNPHPGRWITNFTLTIMAVFFMQQKRLLPPLNQLRRDYERKSPSGDGSDELQTLLVGFFQFYSSFDYKCQAMSVIEGVAYPKPDFASMYIENPVEPGLNICKNLSADELNRVLSAMRTASWLLQSTIEASPPIPGILKLFTDAKLKTPDRPPTKVDTYFDGGRTFSGPEMKKQQKVPSVLGLGEEQRRRQTDSSPQSTYLLQENPSKYVRLRKRNLQQNSEKSGFKPRW